MHTEVMATFQMKEYRILKLYLDNPFADFSEESTELFYIATYRSIYENEEWNGFIRLGFKLESEKDQKAKNKSAVPLFETVIAGTFAEKAPDSPEAKTAFEKKLRINGASTLIPLLRAALASAGTLMGFPGTYKIPNINVFGLEWSAEAD